jgi:hypothetical protein
MPVPNLSDLMLLYARRGVADWIDWKKTQSELRKRAGECLGTKIAENDAEAAVTLNTVYNGRNKDRLRFIPMPKHRKGGIERCFFLPIREVRNGKEKWAFDLFLLVGAKNCLAFRFEQAHPAPSTHDFGHIQMSRKMLRKEIIPKTLPWIPDSYPAFPIPTSDPLRMFLCVATAVHGYGGGVMTVLQEIFQSASRLGELGLYVDELKQVLKG